MTVTITKISFFLAKKITLSGLRRYRDELMAHFDRLSLPSGILPPWPMAGGFRM
jgi:hypothetical protein